MNPSLGLKYNTPILDLYYKVNQWSRSKQYNTGSIHSAVEGNLDRESVNVHRLVAEQWEHLYHASDSESLLSSP